MYSGGKDQYKANFLFKLAMNSKDKTVLNGATKLIRALEHITVISCIVISDCLLKDDEQFSDDEDDI